jgi:uncharacterized protein (DUF58 family)
VSRAAGILVAGALLVVVAFAFDTSGLFVPGVAFLVVGVLVPPWIWLASRSTSVSRDVELDRVLEDQPLEARIEVRGGPLGVPGGEILDPLAGGPISLTSVLFAPRHGRTADVRVVARFGRRGRRRLEPPALSLRDPLGLLRIVRQGQATSQSLLVLPRLDRPRWSRHESGDQFDRQAGAASLEALAAVEIDGLRPYRAGTPASRISWPALARGAGLLERRMRAERDSGPLVVLDVRSGGHPERADAAVRAAASLTHELARRSGCELLLPGDRRPVLIETDLCAWPSVHVRLALLEEGPEGQPPSLSARPRSGMIFYVAAQHERLPTQLLRGDHRGAVLVLPSDVAPPVRQPARFEVSGCVGYLLSAGGRVEAARERAA